MNKEKFEYKRLVEIHYKNKPSLMLYANETDEEYCYNATNVLITNISVEGDTKKDFHLNDDVDYIYVEKGSKDNLANHWNYCRSIAIRLKVKVYFSSDNITFIVDNKTPEDLLVCCLDTVCARLKREETVTLGPGYLDMSVDELKTAAFLSNDVLLYNNEIINQQISNYITKTNTPHKSYFDLKSWALDLFSHNFNWMYQLIYTQYKLQECGDVITQADIDEHLAKQQADLNAFRSAEVDENDY